MKTYIYESSVKQQADILCYAFSPDLIDASEEELTQFLQVLCQHFPKTKNGEDSFKPMEDQVYLNTFNSAYSNVFRLIETNRTKNRHWQMFGVAFLTLVVLAVTLGNDLCTKNQNPKDQPTPTLNKQLQPPAGTSAE